MKTVSLENLRRRMLPPIHVPELGLQEHVVGTRLRDPKSGASGFKKVTRRLPPSVTLAAKGTPGSRVDGLPEAVAASPEVLAAKARGDIRILVAGAPTQAASSQTQTQAPPAAQGE
jgi:hypothetical protein